MATMTIKSTYSLDTESVRTLERLARRWKVSKSEALRRAIKAVSGGEPGPVDDALGALDRLQRALGLTPSGARSWTRRLRAERRASSARLHTRRR